MKLLCKRQKRTSLRHWQEKERNVQYLEEESTGSGDDNISGIRKESQLHVEFGGMCIADATQAERKVLV